jgi:hypothetical protein
MSVVKIQGNAAGTGTLTIAAPNTNNTQVLTLPDLTATLAVNGPAFSAYQSSGQAITASTATKISFQTKEFDTASAFSSGTVVTNGDLTNRFTPQIAGYYQFNAAFSTGSAIAAAIYLYKNGSSFKTGNYNNVSVVVTTISALIFMNGSTDYVEAYAIVGANSTIGSGVASTYFQAAMVRAA